MFGEMVAERAGRAVEGKKWVLRERVMEAEFRLGGQGWWPPGSAM